MSRCVLVWRGLRRPLLGHRQECLCYWNFTDELRDFAVLLGAGFFVGDY